MNVYIAAFTLLFRNRKQEKLFKNRKQEKLKLAKINSLKSNMQQSFSFFYLNMALILTFIIFP